MVNMQHAVRVRNDIPECALFAESGIGGKDMKNFTKVGSKYECFSTFIPPYVLDNMAKAGIEEAKSTILQSQAFREKRAEDSKKIGLLGAVAPIPIGRAYVQVFNSHNTQEFQKELVRNSSMSETPDKAVEILTLTLPVTAIS